MAMNGELLVLAKLRVARKLRRARRGGGLAVFNGWLRGRYDGELVRYREHLSGPIPSLVQVHPTKGYRHS